MGVWADFFFFGPIFFTFSNLYPFPFEPKETKIREDNFSELKEREESSSIFVVGESIYNVKFNMNAQTPRGGLGPKGCVCHTPMILVQFMMLSNGQPLTTHCVTTSPLISIFPIFSASGWLSIILATPSTEPNTVSMWQCCVAILRIDHSFAPIIQGDTAKFICLFPLVWFCFSQ